MNARDSLSFGEDAPLFEVMSTMRAMRRLKPDPVPPELIEKLIQAATYGPSGGNNQLYSFVVVTDREQIARLTPVWQRIAHWYIATQSPPPHMDAGAWDRLVSALHYQADHFDDIPVLIIACYELTPVLLRRMLHTPAKQLNGIRTLGRRNMAALRNFTRAFATAETASVYPGMQNLLLAARALGLAATLTTWHVLLEQEVKAIFGIPRRIKTFAIIPVGWPAGNFGPISRRPPAEAIHWERW